MPSSLPTTQPAATAAPEVSKHRAQGAVESTHLGQEAVELKCLELGAAESLCRVDARAALRRPLAVVEYQR